MVEHIPLRPEPTPHHMAEALLLMLPSLLLACTWCSRLATSAASVAACQADNTQKDRAHGSTRACTQSAQIPASVPPAGPQYLRLCVPGMAVWVLAVLLALQCSGVYLLRWHTSLPGRPGCAGRGHRCPAPPARAAPAHDGSTMGRQAAGSNRLWQEVSCLPLCT